MSKESGCSLSHARFYQLLHLCAFDGDDAEVAIFGAHRMLDFGFTGVPGLCLVHVLELDDDLAIGRWNAAQAHRHVIAARQIFAARLFECL